MKRNSQKKLKDYKKIYFGLATYSILRIYKRLDPFKKLRYRPDTSEKISFLEVMNIIAIRCVIMIYSLVVNIFLTVLFGVVPISVFMHSACSNREKNFIIKTTLILSSAAILIIIHIILRVQLNLLSVAFAIVFLIIMHAIAYLAVRKKYKKISIKLYEKE